ncbi:tyrosine--tRNA ligase [Anaerocolumna cellulosilytica]|uniref:Tyrosine--tRNA ligase n=1 Tax=Anaerocolumna cellulosilytica TaxID=433286 RepID=A0A6S6R9G7_9FIRM|nr:tyrosine--tRNA ligase [Anaerocolumna cellulosilytica]MBB5198011.1 tyrosyl-tRNA synthetase [Anaerocolumna cellulosilytica]BCJ95531.1 tyrosine--tRNA ligase [Anaerocolumna cellulosilytica]
MKSVKEQMDIILKGVDTVVSRENLEKKLQRSVKEGKPLTIKLGLDPSAPDIHLGHAVVLRKIKQMQDLGHRAVIVIGDFTGKIGDPTGKSKGRNALSEEQVKENAKTYTDQIFEILDESKTEVCFNSEWLSKLRFDDVLRLASTTTVARMLERDDFQKRYRSNAPIGMHEFFYPLMQAYDSIALKADIELGGTDQTFNILMGRHLQKSMEEEQQVALFMPILEGLDGVEKMSKSLGNYIGVHEPAQVMFKKVMEVPDNLIIKYYELTTDMHPDEIRGIQEELQDGKNPRDVKYELAQVITELYHTKEEVAEAMDFYEAAFQKKSIPYNIPEFVIDWEKDTLSDVIPLLVQAGQVKSGSEFRRLLLGGGVQLNQERLNLEDLERVLVCQDVLKIGKKIFLRIIK